MLSEIQNKKCEWSNPEEDGVYISIPKGDYHVPGYGYRIYNNFELMKREVTWQDYQKCVDAGVCVMPHGMNFELPFDLRAAVSYLLPEEAETYCEWIGGRLPTINEWQYAAMLDKDYHVRDVIFPWGNQTPNYCIHASYAFVTTESGNGGYSGYKCYNGLVTAQYISFSRSSVVGCYPAGDTPLGLQDMAGNVREWVISGDDYVAVGGSSESGIQELPVLANGLWTYTIYNLGGLGVRCARDVD